MSHSADPTAPDYIPDDLAPAVASTVADYEAEMDVIHPGWRVRAPFHMLPYDRLARMKWLMKRRSLLLHRERTVDRFGKPTTRSAPRDWEVLIVPDARDKRKCYAHPVIPAEVREVTREPARVTS